MKSFAHSFTRPLLVLIGLMLLSLSGFYLATPTPVAAASCVYYLDTTTLYPDGNGGITTVRVTANKSNPSTCSWTAKANSDWLSVVSGASGKGSGEVQIKREPNPNNFVRNGTLTIAGKVVYVYQGAACNYVVSPQQLNAPTQGGTMSVNLSVAQGCTWTFQSNVTWMQPSVIVGNQGGQISFNVDPNPGAIRTGTLTLAGKTITVTQQPTCTYALTPTSQSVPGAGGTYSAQLTTPAGCHWNAATDSGAWVKFNGNTSGTGSATISYTVLANPEDYARTGLIGVVNKQLTISQAKAQPAPQVCTHTASPASQSAPAAGGTYTMTITKSANCPVQIVSEDDWIVINNSNQQTNLVTVQYTVKANTGVARSGEIIAATNGNPVKVAVQQAAGTQTCQGLNLSPAGGQINWLIGIPFSIKYVANSGQAPYTFTIYSGTLPAGLQLNNDGTFSGTPTTPGTTNFTVKAQDVNGCVGYSIHTMTINDCPAGGCGSLLGTPDPLLLCNGATTGVVTLNWSAPAGVNSVEIHVDTPFGPLLKSGGATGSYTSGNWAKDGMKFFLTNPLTLQPLAYHIVKATSQGCNGSGTLTASPNPIAVCDGSGLGITTLSWNATGVTNIEVRAGAPNGTLIASGGATGNFTTGKIVTNGMVFYLMDANANYVLATTTVNHTQQGCGGGGGGTLTVTTNPVQVCDGTGMGIATLQWEAQGYNLVQLRVGSPNGAVFATGSEIGSAVTGKWVTDGMQIFLVDGETLATLASATINVTTQGCPPAGGGGVGTIKATPNPIKVCDGSGFGLTRIEWTYTAGVPVEVRVGNPNGAIIGQGAGNGVAFTGKWVSNGLMFYLVEAATGNVVAQVKATVTNLGCK